MRDGGHWKYVSKDPDGHCMAPAINMGSLAPGGQFSEAAKVVMGIEDSYDWHYDKGVTNTLRLDKPVHL
ncbi:hypothetical protein GC102_20400 [Paenibacillus sp. LMG 31460]|uniref:Uncharacterized protein n=1 Tax=Paenibacillus germinis TaxID=2654979 RepID=A0ABX1Z3Y6_9BACL|nr:hypothetical protein [Paenibacillus germinis]NOU88112.1 hypothetical protein [Paenibacillus germinis]